jgi:hypothetical protein
MEPEDALPSSHEQATVSRVCRIKSTHLHSVPSKSILIVEVLLIWTLLLTWTPPQNPLACVAPQHKCTEMVRLTTLVARKATRVVDERTSRVRGVVSKESRVKILKGR